MMRKENISIILLQIVLFLVLQIVSAQATEQFDLAGALCRKFENVSTNGTYHTNVLSVLTTLTNLSSSSRFSKTSSGSGLDRVNGVYTCRPDLSLDTCQSCINAAISDTFNRYCFNKKEAIIWYNDCMIRYTNVTIKPMQTKPWFWNWSIYNVSRPDIFPAKLNMTMKAIIANASSPTNTQRFAYGSASFTPFEGLYGMAWCNLDTTAFQCKRCLNTAFSRIPNCCAGGLSEWTIVQLPSCRIRYDTAPFIFPASTPQLTPAPVPALAPASALTPTLTPPAASSPFSPSPAPTSG